MSPQSWSQGAGSDRGRGSLAAGRRHARRATTSTLRRGEGHARRIDANGSRVYTGAHGRHVPHLVALLLARLRGAAAAGVARRRAAGAAIERLKASRRSSSPARRGSCGQRSARSPPGRAFLLQAGDCAESFHDFDGAAIREQLKILLQMSAVLTYGAALPVVKVGRIAGQFVKPRSVAVERVGDVEMPVFRGHMIHDDAPTVEARTPDPERMVQGYHQSAATLNLLRAFTKGGFADLKQVHLWNQEFVASSPQGRRYEALASEIERALAFMAACGIDLAATPQLHEVDVCTSHEGLLLDYEEGLTRRDSLTGDWYDCSAHMLWIGERTRQPDGAHVEFFSGVHNPLGVQARPDGDRRRGRRALRAAEPAPHPRPADVHRADGRDARRGSCCRRCCARCARTEHPVVWACDPMHANVFKIAGGCKTRRFDDDHGRDRGLLRRLPRRRASGRAASTSSTRART